jgi:Fe-S oxidoreductase
MTRLPLLEARRSTLEKCVFCPKLCRSACPVSNAEPRETVTPWGKMSMAYFVAHGDVPLDRAHAAPAWACTGCYACREACDHRNDVASTLFDARASLEANHAAPGGALRAAARFHAHDRATREAVRELSTHPSVRADAPEALLVGCAYARAASREARDAVAAASALLHAPVSLVEACCGLPLLHAGDAEGFARQAAQLAGEARRARRLLVADAGCAIALRVRYPAAKVELPAPVELLVELAARSIGQLAIAAEAGATGPVRYHDPCQLGRGLGVYEAPRVVLTRALGRAPDEFFQSRERAACSGAGGLLPATMPATARTIAGARLDEHERAGGGRVVTACGSSLLALRRRGRFPVDDLVTWIARAARRS